MIAAVYNFAADNFSQVTSKFSLTTDIWTSPTASKMPFMAVTGHWIDEDFQLKSILLDFVAVPGRHDGLRLAAIFQEVVDDYELKGKIIGVTTDNASNNDTFITELLRQGYIDSPECNFRCFAHVLNLAAQDALLVCIYFLFSYIQELKGTLTEFRENIKAISASPQRLNRLQTICGLLDPPLPYVEPILDVATRWNSVLDMILRGLRLRRAIDFFLLENRDAIRNTDDKSKFTPLSDEDWVKLEEVSNLLKPFSSATVSASGSKITTLSEQLPWYDFLLNFLDDGRSVWIFVLTF